MKKKDKTELVKAWVAKAQKDLVAARDALKRGENYTDVVCFHVQQSAEKVLKACLVWFEIEFPKTHRLEVLLDLIAQKDASLEDRRDAIESLTPYAVETRYPEFSLPSLAEAKRAVEVSDELMKRVKLILPKKCLPSR